MAFIEIIKTIIYGVVEGITEWLPVSSTGHLILLNSLMPLNVSDGFWDMFLVVIQLGAVLAVVVHFWNRIWPFNTTVKTKSFIRYDVMNLWTKIIVACIPAAVVGIFLDDWIDAHLYNSTVVAIMLILVGIAFIIVENNNRNLPPCITNIRQITYRDALLIGLAQVVAAVFPGTSRSGATIIGGLMIGIERTVAAEFTFFMAIPVMLGASLLKVFKFGFAITGMEFLILIVGCLVAFGVSIVAIKFLLNYVKNHDFKVFGYYRIVLGFIVLLYFLIK